MHMTMLMLLDFNMWKLYLLGIPGQIAIWLWFRLFRPSRKEKTVADTQEENEHEQN